MSTFGNRNKGKHEKAKDSVEEMEFNLKVYGTYFICCTLFAFVYTDNSWGRQNCTRRERSIEVTWANWKFLAAIIKSTNLSLLANDLTFDGVDLQVPLRMP